MANIDSQASAHAHKGHGESEPSYLVAKRGILSWLITIDHKRLGVMYLAATLFFFLVAGLLAIALRTELFSPQRDFMTAQVYNQVMTLHGAIMVFLFIIPAVPAALGNFLLPLMLGTKDVAFPKLNLLSFYVYCFAAMMLVTTLFVNGVDTGWTFYTPYSKTTNGAVILATGGVFIAGFSSILTGLNFVVTVHKMRAPGMSWYRMPLFVWAIYATALIQIMATPVLAITVLLLLLERVLSVGIFDPSMGGDPVLFQHFFWFYSHPAVYIMILPGFGIISEIITVHSRKHIFGYSAIAMSSVAIAVISFLVWGHHMFVSGQSELAGVIFSFLTFAVAIPTAIKVFSWVATLYGGSIRYTTAMWYAMAFLWTFTVGGVTGLYLSTLSTDVHLHDTYFVVAHFHYVMVGGTVVAFIGGLHHWWPKMFGRMYNEKAGALGCFLVFVGFNMTFMTQFFLGHQGMPRRYYAYLPEYVQLHQVSTIGSWVLCAGLVWTLIYLTASLSTGKRAPANPWGGVSLEWQTASPPIEHNFHDTPVVTGSPYDFPEIAKTGRQH
jgi:cytochrome c oxidase subunit 1